MAMDVYDDERHAGCAPGLVQEAKLALFDFGYAYRDGGYCDGAASGRHVGTITLQSATNGPIHFEGNSLEVAVRLSDSFMLRGWDLRAKGSYRLDGWLRNGNLKIDLNAAIRPLELTADKLGLYAWRYDGLERIYAPVSLGRSGLKMVVFRNPGRIASIKSTTLCPADNTDCMILDAEFNNREGGDALITLSLPPVSKPGRYRLIVVARETRPNIVTGVIDIEL